jgi:hypothetical protein
MGNLCWIKHDSHTLLGLLVLLPDFAPLRRGFFLDAKPSGNGITAANVQFGLQRQR